MIPKFPLLAVAGVAVATAGGGCSFNKQVSDEAKRRASAEQERGAEGQRSAAGDPQQAVILVEGIYGDRKTQATGVIFESRRGLALTANHAIEAAPAIVVTLADGSPRRARLVARAQCHDLAVLRLTPALKGIRPIPFAPPKSVRLGQAVEALSFGLSGAGSGGPRLTLTHGTVAAVDVRATFTPLPPMASLVAHQAPLTAAASGSPLLDERGRLVGINTLVAHAHKGPVPDVEYALSSDYIRKRLRELKPGPNGTLGGWRAEHEACHHALARLIAAGHTHDGPPAATTAPPPSTHAEPHR